MTTHIHILMKCSHKIYRIVTVLMLLANSDIRNYFEQPLSTFEVVSFSALCHLRSPRSATVPRQRRDGCVLQKLPGYKQNTTRQLQQVSCFAVWHLPRYCFVIGWVGRSSSGSRSLLHLYVLENNKHQLPLRAHAGWSRFDCIKPP